MPRRTRAGARPAIHEDEPNDSDGAAPRQETPGGREPLGEIVHAANTPQQEANIVVEIDLSKPAKKSGKKATKKTAPRTPKKSAKASEARLGVKNKENVPEVLEDECQSEASSAVEEACQDLKHEPSKASSYALIRDSPRTPSSRAVLSARKQLEAQASRVHDFELSTTLEETERKGAAEPLAHEPARSPTLKAPTAAESDVERIEDSANALDAFEDAIAEIGAAIPVGLTSPAKKSSFKAATNHEKANTRKSRAISPKRSTAPSAAAQRTNVSKPPSAVRTKTGPGTNAAVSKPVVKGAATIATTSTAAAAGRRSTISGRSNARPASLRKAPFVPVKSSKPTTTSIFTLPGEAVAAKLKEQREERQKRNSIAPSPAKLATSRSGAATVRGTSFAGPNNRARTSVLPPQSSPRPLAARNATIRPATKRIEPSMANTLTMPKTTAARSTPRRAARISSANTITTQINGATRAQTKVPTNPPNSLAAIFTPPTPEEALGAATPTGPQSTVRPRARPSTGLASTRARPLAPKAATLSVTIAARARVALESERKAKEEAAKRARADAAERGRLASREWAERQRVKAAGVKRKAALVMVAVAEVEAGMV